MVNIIYRNYQNGDEEQLADLYNKAFQMNGPGYLRTKENLNWRYIQYPGFESGMIQIAEDIDNNKIVGAVYVNPVEKVRLNGEICLIGSINDVSCHPRYIRKGIASNLMKMAMEYMKKTECMFDIIIADISDPIEEGPALKIYTKGFYTLVKKVLAPKGIFVTHATEVHYSLYKKTADKIFNILRGIFPRAKLYFEYIPSFICLWGFALASLQYDPEKISSRTRRFA